MGGGCVERKKGSRGGRCLGGMGVGEMGGEEKGHTVIYTKADVDGGDGVGREGAAEEDGDVEEEVVLPVGCFGGLDVDVCEEGLHVDPGLRAGRCRGKRVGEEDDDEGVGRGGGGSGDGGVEMAGDAEAVDGGDEERTADRWHRRGVGICLTTTLMSSRPRPASLDHDAVARAPRPAPDHPLSSPPTTSSFHIPHTATHAGGILPSASFFRPSRPHHDCPASPASPPDFSPIRPQPSQDSDLRRTSDSPSLPRLAAHLKRSQEPLLPFATHPPSSSKPSHSAPPPPPPHRPDPFCSARVWRNPSLDSAPDVAPLSVARRSLHRPHPVHDTAQFSAPLAPLVQIPPSRPPSSSPSPNNVFISDPPKTFPPLFAIPLTPQKRVFQLYPSRNRFFCAGRLLTGGDAPWAFIASLVLVLAISATWFSTTCVWWWHNESPAVAAVGAYMTLLTISCMLATVSVFQLFLSDHLSCLSRRPFATPEFCLAI